ncbi:hypothetical protein MHYP_G00076480 [Metynnis hypsauchen]
MMDRGDVLKSLFGCFLITQMSVGMSWLLWVWSSVTVMLVCDATFYETIQQHLAPPGTNIQILGECGSALSKPAVS